MNFLRLATLPLVIAERMLVEVYLGHNRTDTLPLEIGELELMLKGEVDIGLRPTTLPPITNVTVVNGRPHQYILLVAMGELGICTRLAPLPPKEEILGVMVKYVDVGLKI